MAQQGDRVSCELRLSVCRGSGDCPQQFLQTDQCDWSAPPSLSSTGLAHSGDQTQARGLHVWLDRGTWIIQTACPGSRETVGASPPQHSHTCPPHLDQPDELVLRPGVDPEGQAPQHPLHPAQVCRQIRQPQHQPGRRCGSSFTRPSLHVSPAETTRPTAPARS